MLLIFCLLKFRKNNQPDINRGCSYKFHLFSINDVVFLRMEEIIKEDKA